MQAKPVGILLALLVASACRPKALSEPLADGRRYVDDPSFRRARLEASLVNRENPYSLLRLAKYREDKWGALPEWNPRVQVVGGPDTWRALDVESVPWEHDALVDLGREAFFRYPVQVQDVLRVGLKHPAAYGLWQSKADGTGGVVREEVRVGPSRLAMTCATCHAAPDSKGELVAGVPNAQLALGAMLIDGFGQRSPDAWGRGRIDLTNDGIDNAVEIPDLRAVRSQHYLHHDGTVRNGLIELALRIETLIITSNYETVRPPRKLAFALALYLWELSPKPVAKEDDASRRGSGVFAGACAGCHKAPDYAGDLVRLASVGTDPTVGQIPERTTGSYRVPSLRGVGDRGPLFASGQVPDLETLMDPQRPMPGHRYGLDLPATDRRDLLAFLRTLK